MLKLKHVLHPLRTTRAAKDLVAAHWNMRRLASSGERRFRNDLRYNLQNVTDGFASRLDEQSDDTALLERICTAYIRATERPASSVEQAYRATNWWQGMRQGGAAAVQRALARRDTGALGVMFRNFFRDPCSAGLICVFPEAANTSSGKGTSDLFRRAFLSDALHRIDYWKAQTGNRFELSALAGPGIGNPFGVLIEGTLVAAGAEYQHYCAQRISDLLPPHGTGACVAEIGGGFGSTAYYLLRDRQDCKYVDFDMPESLALASYYLLKSFPHLSFLLFGEEELTERSCGKFNVILMPAFQLGKVPTNSIDLTFSSHTMSCLAPDALDEYMNEITRFTRNFFLYVGDDSGDVSIQELMRTKYPALTLTEKRLLGWNIQGSFNMREVECLYQIRPARPGAGLA